MASGNVGPIEDMASSGGEVGQPEVPAQQPAVGESDRLLAAVATLAEQQATFMQWQTAEARTRGSSTGLLERFRKLFSVEFEGTADPGDAEEWLRAVERVFSAMGVTDVQRVTLAAFSLKGDARDWWEAFERQWTTPVPGVLPAVPRTVTWDRFVMGFNEHFFPRSWRMEQEAAFIELRQGDMSVAEYEVKFARLSRYAPDLVSTGARRCQRFRTGLSHKIATRLTVYECEDYAQLVDMARRVGRDIQEGREMRKKSRTEGSVVGKSSGGGSRSARQKAQGSENREVGRTSGGSIGWDGEKPEQGTGRQVDSGSVAGPRQCYNCGSADHFKRDCPSLSKGARCYACGEFGHIAVHCPRASTPGA